MIISVKILCYSFEILLINSKRTGIVGQSGSPQAGRKKSGRQIVPRRPQDASKTPQDGPRCPKDGPKRLQEAFKRPQVAFKTPQDAFLGPQDGSEGSQDASGPPAGPPA